MKKRYLKLISILILMVLIASSLNLPAMAASGAWVSQTYVQGPADNPLKGFLPWQGNFTNFPHSMEFNSFAWSDVQTGTNTFNWTVIDNFLNDVSSRGHQAVFRFYADYPNRPYAVPGFLSSVPKNAYTDYSNCSTACSYSPDYNDATLITAMTNFIAALGARYDGDARVAFVQTGLIGFWGEWHTYRDSCACDTWMPSTATQNTILQAFDNAFSTTKIVQRLPMGNSVSMNLGYHDDSFNYTTYGATSWYFWPLMTAAGAQNKWRTEPIGGELRPEIQLTTWQTSGLCVTGGAGDQQCFNTSVDTTHSSWQLAHQLFSPGNTGTEQTRAIAGAKRQGYDLFVSQVALPDTTTTGNVQVDVRIQNKGVAPFYYNWPVQIAVANSSNAIVATWTTPWDLRSVIDQGVDVQYSFTKTGHGLAVGTYKLLMRAVNPLANGKPLVFANQKWGQDVANWLTLDTFTVSSGSVATNTSAPAVPVTYEAEATGNTLTGGAVTAACSTCSGSNKVGYVGNNAGTLQFNGVNAATAGSFPLVIYYINGEATARSATLSVNGGTGFSLSFPGTGGWNTVGSIQTTVTLNAGANTLKFSNPVVGSWAPDFDRITVNTGSSSTNTPIPPTATKTNTPVPATPTNTNTSVPPTATNTNTPIPATPTNTNTSVPPTATNTSAPAVPVTYEAEASGNTLTGGAVTAACSTCSGSNKVGYVGNNAGTLQFNGVNAATAGSFPLVIYYINGEATARSATLSVNGGAGVSLSFPGTGGWNTVGSIQTTVTLNAGANTLKFSNPVVGSWAPDFDRITVNTGSSSTNTPVPPTATKTNTPVPSTPTKTNTPMPATPTNIATVPAGGTTYYVATTGLDTNPGTISQPWKTIQKAANSATAGSMVYVRGGTYSEVVTVNVSGTAAGGYITFQNYPGEVAIVDGTGKTPSGQVGLFGITNKNYIKIIGFEIRNYKFTGTTGVPIGVWVTGSSHHIEIRNNKVHDIWNTNSDGNAHGIAVYGSNGTSAINNVIIDGNEVYSLQLGWSESVVVNGNVDTWWITNNIVHDNNNIGIDAIGFEGTASANDQARNGVIARNTVYNIDTSTNPSYGGERNASCIYVDGGTNIMIEQNIAHHCNLGIQVASEHAGKTTDYVTVRNNFVYNNTQAGIAFGGYSDAVGQPGSGSANNNVIVNNTLYSNFTQGDWGAELYIQYNTNNNVVRNNIIYATSARKFIESWSAVMSGNVVDNNMYFASGGGTNGTWIWKGATYSTFATYQSGSTNDANGVAGVDPLLVSTVDLHLQSTSPAIDAGANLAQAGTVDIDGQTRTQGPAIDRGADEVR